MHPLSSSFFASPFGKTSNGARLKSEFSSGLKSAHTGSIVQITSDFIVEIP
jgi:hypothetical protein